MSVSPAQLHNTRTRAAMLREFLEQHPIDPADPLLAEVDGDVDAYINRLVAEDTSLLEVFTVLYSMLHHDEELVRSNKAWVKKVEQRTERIEARAEQRRSGIAKLLEACNLKNIELGIATLSHILSKGEVIITNKEALPAACMTTPKTPEPRPDRDKIREAIERDGAVPGAYINRKLTLIVRTK